MDVRGRRLLSKEIVSGQLERLFLLLLLLDQEEIVRKGNHQVDG